jgi:hypothetical protein
MAELDIDSQRVTTAVSEAEAPPSPPPAPEPEPRRRPFLGWVRAVGPVPIGAAAVLLFFAAAFGVRHIRVPIGLDSYFYVQSLRITARYGLKIGHLLARPAFPLVGAEMAQLFHTGPWTATVAMTLAMTGTLGMAGGAVFARWRLKGWALAASILLVGASVTSARLLAGKSENLMNVWLLTAVLAVALWGRGRRGVIAAAALAMGAGLSEWPFLAAFLLILCVSLLVWEFLPWSPAVRARRTGTGSNGNGAGGSLRATATHLSLRALLLATVLGAAMVAIIVVLWNGTGPSDAVQLSPLPADQYLIGLKNQLKFEWPLLTPFLFLIGWWAARRFRNPDVDPVRWLLTVWAGIAVLTILVGLTGVPLPAYRALTFDLPIGLGVAAATFLPAAAVRAASGWRRAGMVSAAVVLALLALVPAFSMWYVNINAPTHPKDLGEILAANEYSLGLGGRPVILVVDRKNPIMTIFLEREIIAATGDAGGQRVLVVVGHAGDIMGGRVPTWGDPGLDALSRSLFPPILAAYKDGAPILVGKTLARPGFDSAMSRKRPLVGTRLAVLRGPTPRPKTAAPPEFFPLPHWWGLVGLSALYIAVLWLCGAGWARLAIPDAPPAVRAALAPAFGTVALTLTTLIIARPLHHLEGTASLAALSIALVASMAAAVVAVRAVRARTPLVDA